jgi:hypothetical protein
MMIGEQAHLYTTQMPYSKHADARKRKRGETNKNKK